MSPQQRVQSPRTSQALFLYFQTFWCHHYIATIVDILENDYTVWTNWSNFITCKMTVLMIGYEEQIGFMCSVKKPFSKNPLKMAITFNADIYNLNWMLLWRLFKNDKNQKPRKNRFPRTVASVKWLMSLLSLSVCFRTGVFFKSCACTMLPSHNAERTLYRHVYSDAVPLATSEVHNSVCPVATVNACLRITWVSALTDLCVFSFKWKNPISDVSLLILIRMFQTIAAVKSSWVLLTY